MGCVCDADATTVEEGQRQYPCRTCAGELSITEQRRGGKNRSEILPLASIIRPNTVLHRLDPRTKFLGTLGFLISVFLFHTFLGYAVATAFLVAMIAISKVPVKFMFKGLKAIVMILLITVVFNIILTPGEVLWRFGIIKVTREGLVLAGRMAIRLVYLVIGSSIMTLTTTPNQLTDGLERLLRPLNKIRVPVHEIAMMMSIALRFIPILLRRRIRS